MREIQTLAPQRERLPRSCSTSMCCERFKHWLPNASVYPDLVRHLCVARDSNIGSPTRAFTPILFDIYVLREIQTLAPQRERLPRSCSTSMCCERFKHWLPNTSVYPDLVRHLCVARDSNIGSPTRAFTPILFDIYVLREIQTLAPQHERLPRSCSTSVLREIQTLAPQHERLPRSCSTSMCCERFKHWLPNTSVYPDLVRHLCVARDSSIGSPTRAFTPILFDIYVLREIQTLAPQHERLPRSCSTSVLREIQTLAPQHERLPRSCSTSMCCERFKHWLPNTSVYPDLVRHLCDARDSNIGSPTRAFTPILFDIYVLREIQTLAPQRERLPRSCSTSMCCERFKHWLPNASVYPDLVRHLCVARDSNIGCQHESLPRSCSTSMCCERFKHWLPTRAFTSILFDIYVLREIQTLAPNTSVHLDLVRHLCVARDSNIGSQHKRSPRSCSTSMCCERFKHWLPTRAFTSILFDIYVLREIQTLAPNTSVYPDLVRHLCVARDSNIGSPHERSPRSCSTSMCCERFKHWLPTQAFTSILFDIYVLREIQTLAPNTSVHLDLVRHLCVARDSNIGSQHKCLPRSCSTSMCCEKFKHWLPTQVFTPILFDIYVLREIQTLAPNTSVHLDLVRHLCVARDSNIGSQHKCLPRSCSTSMCCERFKHWLPTRAFTPILFDIYVLRRIKAPILFDIYVLPGIQTLAPSTSVYPDLVSQAFTPILFDIYVL